MTIAAILFAIIFIAVLVSLYAGKAATDSDDTRKRLLIAAAKSKPFSSLEDKKKG